MIVVSRRRGDALVIGDNIIVTIVEIRGDKVRIGIEHPPEVSVHRQEVWEVMKKASSTASAPTSAVPVPHVPELRPDGVGRFAAILEVKLGVPVTRQMIVQALREADVEMTDHQPVAR